MDKNLETENQMDVSDLLGSIKVETFRLEPLCGKCGSGGLIHAEHCHLHELNFCKGSFPPTIEIDSAFVGKQEHAVPCSPITHEHFHVKCWRCNFFWYMHTKDSQR